LCKKSNSRDDPPVYKVIHNRFCYSPMKNAFLSIPVALLLMVSCESFLEEEEVILLPVNVTTTVVQGTQTKKIIADYHYVPGTGRPDHITRSDHQTHYFEYDASGRIKVLRMVKVDEKLQEEMWFYYDGTQVEKVLLVERNLDYIFLEPVDSVFSGSIRFEYEGGHIIEETRREVTDDGKKEEMVWKVEYTHDREGNIISTYGFDPGSQSEESETMTYDQNKHPFSDLQYYFTGESFVNNMLSKSIDEQGIAYNYELRLNEYGYPEIVYEKLGASNSRIIRYSYMSQ